MLTVSRNNNQSTDPAAASRAKNLTLTCILSVEHLQGVHHGTGKHIRVLLAAEVKAVHLPRIAPLVEGLRGLVVFQPLGNGTVYHHLRGTGEEREG